jgi:ribosome recycling factor
MIEDVRKDAATRMGKSIDSLKHEFAKIRTGRAHTNLLDLTVSPWEKQMVAAVEKAIMTSDLGLNPATAGTLIRVPLPALTEERRRDLIKVVRHEAELGRVAIRNIRRDALHTLKELLKEKEISEDQERRAETEIQKLTDQHVARADEMLAEKEQDLLSI